MARPDMTLSVVGGIHANADGSNRLFEIALCAPGEPVALVPEPRNRHDPSAVAVFSTRGIQIGYLSAERCGWIGSKIRLGEEIRALFQAAVKGGALIRVSFSGLDPDLPASAPVRRPARLPDWDDSFYPDETWPDDEALGASPLS
ncbi:HIRAN domain-containing protein [Sphingomonas oryzagri]